MGMDWSLREGQYDIHVCMYVGQYDIYMYVGQYDTHVCRSV